MAQQLQENLPSEVKEQMPSEAQQIFQAAFKSASDDGMSEEGALNVAWYTVKQKYEKGEDGKWQRKPEESNVSNTSVPSVGGY